MRIKDSSTSGISAEEIAAQGKADERRYKVVAVGTTIAILALGGVLTFFFQPTISKDVWLFLGPVITGAIAYLMNGKIS